MIHFRRPPDQLIYERLRNAIGKPFTYEGVGGTAGEVPPGYREIHTDGTLGRGDEVFERAKLALRALAPFHLGWVEFIPEGGLGVGTRFCVLSRQFGFWAINLTRIVYLIDEPDRFGFAVGTLAMHLARGEERFMVERESDEVSFHVFSFSRPAHWLTWIGLPIVRIFQKRFGRACLRAMRKSVNPDG